MNNLNDEPIIDRVIGGETELYNQIIEKHKSYAFTIALKILDNREDAEEAAHDSFIKAYQNLNKFNREAKFSTWLYRIVFNTAITYKRKQKVKKESLDILEFSHGEGSSNNLELQDQKRFIHQAMSQLSDQDRVVISLFYLKEHSIEEISEITAISASNVKVKLHRARKRLADNMKMILKEEALNL